MTIRFEGRHTPSWARPLFPVREDPEELRALPETAYFDLGSRRPSRYLVQVAAVQLYVEAVVAGAEFADQRRGASR